MTKPILGLDIGGANLKTALSAGAACNVPFALWKAPGDLPGRLRDLLAGYQYDQLAVTMTGELCDCFATKAEGVTAILKAVQLAAPKTPIAVWTTEGSFADVATALADPWQAASANWLALATFAGRLAPRGPALLIDVGSTTTDLIPLLDGTPVPQGRTDPERLQHGELVYTGVRRTPICSILGMEVAAELFATTLDVYLTLDLVAEAEADCDTADGRPATKRHAQARLARMMCSDVDRFSAEDAFRLARAVYCRQRDYVATKLERVSAVLPGPPAVAVISGSGEFLARALLQHARPEVSIISLAAQRTPALSIAACAYAVAVLAAGS